jgi:hypothetical protein
MGPNRYSKTAIVLSSLSLRLLDLFSNARKFCLLSPVFISSQWGQTYNGNFLAAYFTVRARALMALVGAVMGMVLNMTTGDILDLKRYRRSTKSKVSWLVVASLFTAMWIWNTLLKIDYARRLVTLNWISAGFHTGAASYVFFRSVPEHQVSRDCVC